MIETVIVEDNLVIRKYLEDMLTADGRFRIAGLFRDAFDAEALCCGSGVDLVLMDIQTLRNHSGLAVGERIRRFGGGGNRCLIQPEGCINA